VGFFSVLVFLLRRGNHQFSPLHPCSWLRQYTLKAKVVLPLHRLTGCCLQKRQLGGAFGGVSQPRRRIEPMVRPMAQTFLRSSAELQDLLPASSRSALGLGASSPACWLPGETLLPSCAASPLSCPWAASLGPAFWEGLGCCDPPASWRERGTFPC